MLADNTIYWIGPRDDAVRPTGPFDPQLPVLAFFAAADRLRGVVFGHSTHTIGTLKPNVRSPSFYGLAAQELEKDLGATVCFLEGASGSTHNITGVTTAEAIERMREAVTAALGDAETRLLIGLPRCGGRSHFACARSTKRPRTRRCSAIAASAAPDHADAIAAVFRQMRQELKPEQGRERKTWLHVLLIGDVAIVGVPAEYFTSLGTDIKRRSAFKDTFIAELAGDWIGYLPDREGHKLGGYQTWMGLHSYAERGTGERIADEVVAMLGELAPHDKTAEAALPNREQGQADGASVGGRRAKVARACRSGFDNRTRGRRARRHQSRGDLLGRRRGHVCRGDARLSARPCFGHDPAAYRSRR